MSMTWLLPIGLRLGTVFTFAKDWVVEKHRQGLTPSRGELQVVVLHELMQITLPTVNGKEVMGTEELSHFSAALAGVVMNYLDAQATQGEHDAPTL